MNSQLAQLLNRTIFITGSDKNAGKTTFLNLALAGLRKVTTPAYLTIGVDGEKSDAVFGTPKPRILAVAGDWLVTTDLSLKESSGSFEIVEVFKDKTVLGRLVLARTLRDGNVEIIGPEDNAGLAAILEILRTGYSLQTILVDGAVNRITQVAAAISNEAGMIKPANPVPAAFVYVARINAANVNAALDKIKIIATVSSLPLYSAAAAGKVRLFPGALTSAKLKQLGEEGEPLVLEDFTRFFISWEELNKLLESRPVYLQNRLELLFFQVNNYDVTSEEIIKTLDNPALANKIIFNPYKNSDLNKPVTAGSEDHEGTKITKVL